MIAGEISWSTEARFTSAESNTLHSPKRTPAHGVSQPVDAGCRIFA